MIVDLIPGGLLPLILFVLICTWVGIGIGMFFVPILFRQIRRNYVPVVLWSREGTTDQPAPFMFLQWGVVYCLPVPMESESAGAAMLAGSAALCRTYGWVRGLEADFPYPDDLATIDVPTAAKIRITIDLQNVDFIADYMSDLKENTDIRPFVVMYMNSAD